MTSTALEVIGGTLLVAAAFVAFGTAAGLAAAGLIVAFLGYLLESDEE